MNRLLTLLSATALAIASVTGAHAATFSFTGIALNGPLAGSPLFGGGTFDEALVPSVGRVTLTSSGIPDPNLVNDLTMSLSLTIFGQTFTQADDIEAPLFPTLTFTDGLLTAIDFIVSESTGFNPTSILQPDVIEFAGFDVFTTQTGTFEYNVTLVYAAIPLPAGLPLAVGALAALGLLRMNHRPVRPAA